ncbi:MAG: acyl-CoA synthetase [Hyphomicrobiales bacterium]|nr:MAG: acyl-CoA synthetase [Hyphomicrobiales bacterium]
MARLTDDVNYSDILVGALNRYPTRDAFVHGDRRITYAETADTISTIMQVLVARGITRGRAISMLSSNVPEVWMVQAAAYLIGAQYSGLHPLGSPDDHAFICQDAGVEVIIAHPDYVGAALSVAERAGSVREVLALGPSSDAPDLLGLAAHHSGQRLTRRTIDAEDVHWIAYTGGTTGRSKGVKIPDRALVQSAQSVTTSLGLPEVPRFLAVAPISHAGVLPIMPTLVRGGTVVVQKAFDPDQWLRTVQDEHINWSFVVPTMLHTLLDRGEPKRFDLSSLETIMYGSSPMSPARISEAHEVLGPVLLQAYGQTECVSFATTLRKDEHQPLLNPERLSSCGRAVLGMRVEILDDSGEPVETGQIGEICVRGRGVMSGYHNLPDEAAKALAGGWLHTGDLATQDEDGFVYIVERAKDMIITGGFNVYSREIEDVISRDPSVSSVAVIGVPDRKWGEAVTAIVVPRPGSSIDTEHLVNLVREKKGSHQAPKSIEVVDQLPVTAVGKIDKKSLRSKYWDGHDRLVN